MDKRNLNTLAGWLLLLAFTKFESFTVSGSTTATPPIADLTSAATGNTSIITNVTTGLSESVSTDQNVHATSVTSQAGTATDEEISTTDDGQTLTLTATDNEAESTEPSSTTYISDQTEPITASTDNYSSSDVDTSTATKVIEDNSASLTGGEIAAIVMCPIVLAVLIPSFILIVLRHRRRSERYDHFHLITRDED